MRCNGNISIDCVSVVGLCRLGPPFAASGCRSKIHFHICPLLHGSCPEKPWGGPHGLHQESCWFSALGHSPKGNQRQREARREILRKLVGLITVQ